MEDNAPNQQQTTLTMNTPDENVLAIAMKYFNQYVRPYILLYPIALVIALIAGLIYSLTVKDYQHVLALDIEEGYKKFNPRMIELKPRRQVGFNS